MSSAQSLQINDNNIGFKNSRTMKLVIAILAIGTLVTIAILGLAIAIFVKVNKESNGSQGNGDTATTSSTTTPQPSANTTSSTTAPQPSANSTLSTFIRIEDVMRHLNELQSIATAANGTRAVSTPGFNQTLDYITTHLRINTDYIVTNTFFPIRQFALASDPILISSINGVAKNYTYSTDLSTADFYFIQFSTAANFPTFAELSVIPNVGCTDADWQNASPPAAGRVALVKRGVCAFDEKGVLAAKYNITGLLIYNDGATPDRMAPIAIGLGQENFIPALFLSYTVGKALADAAVNASTNTGVRLIINVQDLPLSPVGNICADTKTGDPTKTIVIGSHSDSVPAGAGINDNGKGKY
jgi:hypothetical protein